MFSLWKLFLSVQCIKIKQINNLPCVFLDRKSSFLNLTLNTLDNREVGVDFFPVSFSFSDGVTLIIIDFTSDVKFSKKLKYVLKTYIYKYRQI